MKKILIAVFASSSLLLVSCGSPKNIQDTSTQKTSSGTHSKEVDQTVKEIDSIINDIGTGTTK